jgi:hypothetical protein
MLGDGGSPPADHCGPTEMIYLVNSEPGVRPMVAPRATGKSSDKENHPSQIRISALQYCPWG